MLKAHLRAAFLCAILTGAGQAQDRMVGLVQTDAREAAKRQVAIILLQRKQSRPTGTQTTPEQDRISNLIIDDYNYVQAHRARWRGTAYLAVFDRTFAAALRAPALKKLDPFKPFAVVDPFRLETANWYPWMIGLGLVGGMVFVCFIALQFTRLLALILRPLARRSMPMAPYSPPSHPSSFPPSGWASPDYPPAPSGGMPAPEQPVCGTCGGTGKMRCSVCWGRGWWLEAPTTAEGQGRTVHCTMCVGSGQLQCTSGYGHRF